MNIYLAGKITKNGWRNDIVPSLRDWNSELDVDLYPPNKMSFWPVWKNIIFGKHNYVGPYFLGCDHGCYHSDGGHCLGTNSDGCGTFDRVAPKKVVELCMKAITVSDLVFAWIDNTECFGTLVELGMARSQSKKIAVASPTRIADLWFASEIADKTVFGQVSAREALKTIVEVRVDYFEYIKSPQWRAKAEKAKKDAQQRCQVCNRSRDETILDAHHRTYERLGQELPTDITVLCRSCHDLYTKSNRLPKPKQ